MEELLFHFVVYALDRRPPEEIRAVLDAKLGCAFEPERGDRPAVELVNRWVTEVLGFHVSLSKASSWPEGTVYIIAGGTAKRMYTPGTKVPLDSHMIRLLRLAGLDRVMNQDEFGQENRARFPELYTPVA